MTKTLLAPQDLQHIIGILCKDRIQTEVVKNGCKEIDFEKLNDIKCNVIGVFGKEDEIINLLQGSLKVISRAM